MSGPNIEMIAASLKKCSLQGGGEGGGRRDVVSPPAVGSPPAEEVTVELNSEVALPYQWEQCLDMKTGKVYFINWSDGTRTTEDPRLSGYYSEEDCYSESSDSDSYDSSSNDNAFHNNYFGTDDNSSTTASSSYSSSSAYSPGEPPVLVAAGCRSCFMYFMVRKLDFTCPKCGGNLLHLGSNGCS